MSLCTKGVATLALLMAVRARFCQAWHLTRYAALGTDGSTILRKSAHLSCWVVLFGCLPAHMRVDSLESRQRRCLHLLGLVFFPGHGSRVNLDLASTCEKRRSPKVLRTGYKGTTFCRDSREPSPHAWSCFALRVPRPVTSPLPLAGRAQAGSFQAAARCTKSRSIASIMDGCCDKNFLKPSLSSVESLLASQEADFAKHLECTPATAPFALCASVTLSRLHDCSKAACVQRVQPCFVTLLRL